MKNLILIFTIVSNFFSISLFGQDTIKKSDTIYLKQVEIVTYEPFQSSIHTPVTFTNMNNIDISTFNYGQEVSKIVSNTPSIINYSESGGDFGYSYIRLRGIDQSRINFTLNGVPMNEPEDQGCFFSNYPNLLKNIESIQIQRGTGMTKNGTSSYAGSMNFKTIETDTTKGDIFFGYGSFNTQILNLGLSQKTKNLGVNISLSEIKTNGYKEHSGNKSKSAFVTIDYNLNKNKFKLLTFTGKQENQLAWYGVLLDSIEINRRYNANSKDEIDNFNQSHIQFHHSYMKNYNSRISYFLYYNNLNGYYTYNYDGLRGINLKSNLFGGNFYLFNKIKNLDLYTGISTSIYNRKHDDGTPYTTKTYSNVGYRNDYTAYIKGNLNIYNFKVYNDIQIRQTKFDYSDFYKKGNLFNYVFLNFTSGLEYAYDKNIFYYSIGQSNREPSRNDIFGGSDHQDYEVVKTHDLKPERVINHELGYRYIDKYLSFNSNLFYMKFQNELILTGEWGLTGLPIHKNVKNSYRIGVETDFIYKWKYLSIQHNMSLSRNKIRITEKQYNHILSPNYISNAFINFEIKNIIIGLSNKYQSFSYIDQSNNYNISGFSILNFNFNYKFNKDGEITIYINNLTNEKYLTSGMMGWDNNPLYFVGSTINFLTGIKLYL